MSGESSDQHAPANSIQTHVLGYRAVPPPRLSTLAYLRVLLITSIRLIAAACLLFAGLTLVVLGIAGVIVTAPMMACAGLVWGPLMVLVGVLWFGKALEILAWGRNYNPRY